MNEGSTQLREVLRLTYQIKEVTAELSAAVPGQRPVLDRRRGLLLEELEQRIADESALPPLLLDLRRQHGLDAQHLVVALLLLLFRIEHGPDFVSGRSILRVTGREPWDLLAGGELLNDSSPLLTREIIRIRGVITDSPLEAEFRIAEWVFERARRQMCEAGQERTERPGPYLSSAAHLLDMKHLVELYQIRAAGIFDDSGWRECYPDADTIAPDISPMILRVRSAITQRESGHGRSVNLPVVAIRKEFGLKDEEEIMILALLFHELFSGPPLLDAGELVRLVSQSEEDVFRRRRLLAPTGRLRESGLIYVDSELEGKDLVGETYLCGWLEERLFEGIDEGSAIGADECRTFHRYMKHLRNSDDFYRNL